MKKIIVSLLIIFNITFTTAQTVKGGGNTSKYIMMLTSFTESLGAQFNKCLGQNIKYKSIAELYVYMVLKFPFLPEAALNDQPKSQCHSNYVELRPVKCMIDKSAISYVEVLDDPLFEEDLLEQGYTHKNIIDLKIYLKAYINQ